LQHSPKSKKEPTLLSAEARGHRLKQLRQLTGSTPNKPLTRAAIERKYGINAHSLKNWEDGHGGGLTESGARRMINVYQQENIHCSIPWLMQGVGATPTRLLPSIQQAPDFMQRTDPIATAVKEQQDFKSLHLEGITFEVKDDAMAPFYLSGDVVGGVRHYARDIDQLINCDCIIETNTGETWLRRLQKSTVPGQYNLYALNPNTKIERPALYAVEVVAAAPVMRIWRGKKWASSH